MVHAVRLVGQAWADTDALLRQTVDEAREHGATWEQIGDALGINAEAAAKRFRARG